MELLKQLGQAVGILPASGVGVGVGPAPQTTTATTDQSTANATAFHDQSRTSATGLATPSPIQTPVPIAEPTPTVVAQPAPVLAHGPVLEQVGKLLSTIFPQDTVTQIMNFIAKFLPAPAIVQTPVQAPTQAAPVAQATNPQTSAEDQAMMTQLMQMLTTPETTAPQAQANPTTATYDPMNPTAGSMTTTIPNNQVPAITNANTANNTLTPQAAPQAAAQDPMAALMQMLTPAKTTAA